ncbi:MAG: hypothetical protein WCS17_13330 [Prevotella sp.]
MGVRITHKGSFKNTERFLNNVKVGKIQAKLNSFGSAGVQVLSSNTPYASGATANSWGYEIHKTNGRYIIEWTNDNVNDGVNIAVILQYGHGTRNGGYVSGRDYINPAMRPLFDKIAEEAWKEVTQL